MEDRDEKDILPDMAEPHPDFPYWTREALYNKITGMYLDAWDDDVLAKDLSRDLGNDISPWVVRSVRQEAAMVADARGSTDIRRRWIYRYKQLTINNLVKEYMFMEGKENFLAAKRELAEEIDQLASANPADRLWIAVNDALGRNNIGLELVYALAAYGRTARKLDEMMKWRANQKGTTVPETLRETASKTRAFHQTQGGRDIEKTSRYVAALLNYEDNAVTSDDVDFLLDYCRFADATAMEGRSFSYRLMFGADVVDKPSTLLGEIMAGRDRDPAPAEVVDLMRSLRAGAIHPAAEIGKIRSFVVRHIEHHQLRRELKGPSPADPARERDLQTLVSFRNLVDGQIEIMDARKFYTAKELRLAERAGVTLETLQSQLDALNSLESRDTVARHIEAAPETGKHVFPSERYFSKRYGTGMV